MFPSYSGSLPSRLGVLNGRHYLLLAYWVLFAPSGLHRYLYEADPELYSRLGWSKMIKSLRLSAYRSLYAMMALAMAVTIALLVLLIPVMLTYHLQGHTSGIAAIAVTPDRQLAISAATDRRIRSFIPNSDRTLKVWNLRFGTERFTLDRHRSSISALALTPDSQMAISGGYDRMIWAWNLKTGKVAYDIGGHERWISDLAVSPDNRVAVSASGDGTLRVWEVVTGKELFAFAGHQDEVNAVAIAPDSQTAVSASRDRTLKVWDLNAGKERYTLTGHQKSVNAVAITPDNRQIISASNDRTLKVWNLATGELLHTLTGHEDAVNLVAVTADNRVVSAAQDNTLKIWDSETGRVLQTFKGHKGWISDLAIADNRLISASSDHTLKVWDMDRGQEIYTLNGHHDRVQGVAVIPEKNLAISVSYDRFPKFWNLASGKLQPPIGAILQRQGIVVLAIAIALCALIAAILTAICSLAIGLAWFGVYGTVAIALIYSFLACGVYTGIAVFIDRLVTHPSFRNLSAAFTLNQSLLILFGLLFGLLLNTAFNLANRKTLAAWSAVVFTLFVAITTSLVVASVLQRPANSLRAPIVLAWKTAIQVGFWFNLLVLAGSLRLPFYPCHFLLALLSRWQRPWHPIYWDETVILPLPGTTGQMQRILDRDPQNGLVRVAQVAANPFQRAAVQRALIHHLHRIDAPLFWLYALVNDPGLKYYCYAPVMPQDWRDFPTQQQLLLGEIAGVRVTENSGTVSRLSQSAIAALTHWRRLDKNTPLIQFAGVLYRLLQQNLTGYQPFGPEQLYSLLEAYPGGVEIHHSFDLMVKFLSYRDLDGIASAVDIVHSEPFIALLQDPDLALRPPAIATLQMLADVAVAIAQAQAAPTSELRAIAWTEAVALLAQAQIQVNSAVSAPDSTVLRRIIDQWQQMVLPCLAQITNHP
ncbi:MAG: WD40 repeat domain-containing protein [Jaaginema sp. PMC 1079.18]|nr:WD40 repeat domain-containing protein [Jaaginema sp. PMC 1080.18]MEC4853773.1 WD40 repeat domain-containing protein [Jaaginema sp. PMC 1079.18]MEC4868579.1 WD40 repeat domain-containing protein [Jaaginema sp. PMC 1078.18]